MQLVSLTPRRVLLAEAELDNLDTAIADLDAALVERAVAQQLMADADRKVRVAQDRCQLLKLAIRVQLATGIGQ